MVKTNIEKVKFWCFKVLPLVYDESLSYYEVLCKCVDKLNEVIESVSGVDETLAEINAAIAQLEEWIENVDTTYISQWIEENLLKMVFVGITDDGYFVIYIPESWDDIVFGTSGLDDFPDGVEYGHLTLSLKIGGY